MKITRFIFLPLFCISLIYAQTAKYIDSDLDGVDDRVDICPNTPFSDIVDERGCSVESLAENEDMQSPKEKREKKHSSLHGLDISLGVSHYDDRTYATVQGVYSYENFSISLFSALDSAINDTRVWSYYKIDLSDELDLKMGAGLVFPALQGKGDISERIDAGVSMNLSYIHENLNPYFGAVYRFNGIDDDYYLLKDNYTIYGGLGIFATDRFYFSTSYAYSSEEYEGSGRKETMSAYFYYMVDENWYLNSSTMYGVEGLDYDGGFSIGIGYTF